MTDPTPPEFDDAFRHGLEALLRWRRDVRRFRCDPLDPGLIDRLLDLADLAPSVGNSQPWRFVSVETPAARAAVRRNFEAANAEALAAQPTERRRLYASLKLAGLERAPVHLAVFTDTATAQGHGLGRRSMPETLEQSTAMAVHTLWLAARACGVGVGWSRSWIRTDCAATCGHPGACGSPPTSASAVRRRSTPTRSWSAPAGRPAPGAGAPP